MSGTAPFADNYRNLSDSDGYQFEFRCERCGNGYRSAFKRSLRKTDGSVIRGLGGILGGQTRGIAR